MIFGPGARLWDEAPHGDCVVRRARLLWATVTGRGPCGGRRGLVQWPPHGEHQVSGVHDSRGMPSASWGGVTPLVPVRPHRRPQEPEAGRRGGAAGAGRHGRLMSSIPWARVRVAVPGGLRAPAMTLGAWQVSSFVGGGGKACRGVPARTVGRLQVLLGEAKVREDGGARQSRVSAGPVGMGTDTQDCT